jgi:hypothetical protein
MDASVKNAQGGAALAGSQRSPTSTTRMHFADTRTDGSSEDSSCCTAGAKAAKHMGCQVRRIRTNFVTAVGERAGLRRGRLRIPVASRVISRLPSCCKTHRPAPRFSSRPSEPRGFASSSRNWRACAARQLLDELVTQGAIMKDPIPKSRKREAWDRHDFKREENIEISIQAPPPVFISEFHGRRKSMALSKVSIVDKFRSHGA